MNTQQHIVGEVFTHVAEPKLAGRCSHYRTITRDKGLCEVMFDQERARAVEDGQARRFATLDWDDVCVGCDEWSKRQRS